MTAYLKYTASNLRTIFLFLLQFAVLIAIFSNSIVSTSLVLKSDILFRLVYLLSRLFHSRNMKAPRFNYTTNLC
jgi:hypothetical protein